MKDSSTCTMRVCEVIFNLIELLVEMGVLKQKQKTNKMSSDCEGANGTERNQKHCDNNNNSGNYYDEGDDERHSFQYQQTEEDGLLASSSSSEMAHNLLMNAVVR